SPRWAPVFRNWFPQDKYGLDWHWRFFQYVFPNLADPRQLEPIRDANWSASEREVLDRYFSHARTRPLPPSRGGGRRRARTGGTSSRVSGNPRSATTSLFCFASRLCCFVTTLK